MNTTKIVIISIIALILIGISTALIVTLKPHMHKTVVLEQIIYKRSK